MFVAKQAISDRLADTVDLLIDFATLGEYGLEPVGRTPPSCELRRRQRAIHVPPARRISDRGVALGR